MRLCYAAWWIFAALTFAAVQEATAENKTATAIPTRAPSKMPTTLVPSQAPIPSLTSEPSQSPSHAPTSPSSTEAPVESPSSAPSKEPSLTPSFSPTPLPTDAPSAVPSSKTPTASPSNMPTTLAPTGSPNAAPTMRCKDSVPSGLRALGNGAAVECDSVDERLCARYLVVRARCPRTCRRCPLSDLLCKDLEIVNAGVEKAQSSLMPSVFLSFSDERHVRGLSYSFGLIFFNGTAASCADAEFLCDTNDAVKNTCPTTCNSCNMEGIIGTAAARSINLEFDPNEFVLTSQPASEKDSETKPTSDSWILIVSVGACLVGLFAAAGAIVTYTCLRKNNRIGFEKSIQSERDWRRSQLLEQQYIADNMRLRRFIDSSSNNGERSSTPVVSDEHAHSTLSRCISRSASFLSRASSTRGGGVAPRLGSDSGFDSGTGEDSQDQGYLNSDRGESAESDSESHCEGALVGRGIDDDRHTTSCSQDNDEDNEPAVPERPGSRLRQHMMSRTASSAA